MCALKKTKAKQITLLLPLPWEILPGWREINTGYSFISSLWVPHHHPQVLFPPNSSTVCPVLEFLYTNFCHSINSVAKTTAVSYCEVSNVPGELLQLASWGSRNQAVPSSTSIWGWFNGAAKIQRRIICQDILELPGLQLGLQVVILCSKIVLTSIFLILL